MAELFGKQCWSSNSIYYGEFELISQNVENVPIVPKTTPAAAHFMYEQPLLVY